MGQIRVTVIKRTGRKYFEARWIDPVTGMKRTQTTKASRRRDAERFAVRLEEKLNSHEREIRLVSFREFRAQYEEDVFPAQKLKTRQTTLSTFTAIETILKPATIASIDPAAVRKFSTAIRKRTKSEFSVARHLRELRKILNWAVRNEFLASAPGVKIPAVRGRKGRDVTHEEFERILLAVEKCEMLEPHQWEPYRFLLKGLYWGGLRISESLLLDWIDDAHLCVDLNRRRPMFRIQATDDKGGKFRMLPMAPEFAELLRSVPMEKREGRVFQLPGNRTPEGNHGQDRVVHILCDIGKLSGVKVSESAHGRVKFASAHDLRRAFGVRWSQRVMPPVLMELMRHADISTTMQFYVGRNAERAASDAWTAYEQLQPPGNTLGNTSPESPGGDANSETEPRLL